MEKLTLKNVNPNLLDQMKAEPDKYIVLCRNTTIYAVRKAYIKIGETVKPDLNIKSWRVEGDVLHLFHFEKVTA